MKVHLLHRDRDVDLDSELPPGSDALTEDLGLETLFAAMAQGSDFLHDVAQATMLTSLTDPEEIARRQDVLDDCLAHPDIVRRLYDLATQAALGHRKFTFALSRRPNSILSDSVRKMDFFVDILRQLRAIADHATDYHSEGFTTLFATLVEQLDDDYFAEVETHLQHLRFRDGVLLSAQLRRGCKGTNHVLREQPSRQSWIRRLLPATRPGLTFKIPDRDDAGANAMSELRNRGINLAANALAQSTDHIIRFFSTLRHELAHYVGCLNLYDQLADKGASVCRPQVVPIDRGGWSARGLYDVGLPLRTDRSVVGNDLAADDARLVVITGANQGGKSTFLRAIGLAQLMLQCGMFVAADSFRASPCAALFTHFKREEDATMQRGKLDEELHRMSDLVDHLRPGSILLCNESFASTNEREGSQIAHHVVRALVESGVRIVFVTHLYELADRLHDHQQSDHALFLRAERRADGQRTFNLVEGAPLPTSYGQDLYNQIFESDSARGDAAHTAAGPPI